MVEAVPGPESPNQNACGLEARFISQREFQPEAEELTPVSGGLGLCGHSGHSSHESEAGRPTAKSAFSKPVPSWLRGTVIPVLCGQGWRSVLHMKMPNPRSLPELPSPFSLPAIIIKYTYYLYNGLDIKP